MICKQAEVVVNTTVTPPITTVSTTGNVTSTSSAVSSSSAPSSTPTVNSNLLSQRAHHPELVLSSQGRLVIDVEVFLGSWSIPGGRDLVQMVVWYFEEGGVVL